jgi:hypothetical protein
VKPLELTRHAVDKLATYGIQGDRLATWHEALHCGQTFIDVSSGMAGSVFWWEERPWVVILSQDGERVVTTYPTDEHTVTNRRGGGRWIFSNT